MTEDRRLLDARFPRASRYHPDWLIANVSGGANPLWMAEWLAEAIDLRPGMRVLDLGCGKAASSIFLRREFGVQVWAVDLWIGASENLKRIRAAGVDDAVFPLHADARSLPFADGFFDAITCIDAYPYIGTDDLSLSDLARLIPPGAPIGITGAALMREIDGDPPDHLRPWWTPDLWALHSAPWWRRHWERTGILSVETADTLPDGWLAWLSWHQTICPDNHDEIQALKADRGEYLGYARIVGKRREGAALVERITSIPDAYVEAPLLRDGLV